MFASGRLLNIVSRVQKTDFHAVMKILRFIGFDWESQSGLPLKKRSFFWPIFEP